MCVFVCVCGGGGDITILNLGDITILFFEHIFASWESIRQILQDFFLL